MGKTNPRTVALQKRKVRVRRKVRGTADRPRLCVFRSLNHIYCQVIDDDSGRTLAAASSLSDGLRQEPGHKGNVATAKKVGMTIAQVAKAAGVSKVVFDRNGFLYHGRIKALADGAREGGLEF
ncbi:ribosomal protein L18 [Desulfarculus baarsii DSM 2075]|uniref:Large ribosomal subunit protein uL18 n=1 Tax=Desulfarculus baarsii (strain ATCC 33931 / DSM 2075 / LMG 7858 / VKM B-1802 / 2st14) TaxID=644282 RepID=E1QKR6_DESB2|nr:50S ribosomal protein L18 [Desulfarculus baarsii]ADK86275.1 ribosomal protein L18 [Desulfarculus baarsii DSM 2075]